MKKQNGTYRTFLINGHGSQPSLFELDIPMDVEQVSPETVREQANREGLLAALGGKRTDALQLVALAPSTPVKTKYGFKTTHFHGVVLDGAEAAGKPLNLFCLPFGVEVRFFGSMLLLAYTEREYADGREWDCEFEPLPLNSVELEIALGIL